MSIYDYYEGMSHSEISKLREEQELDFLKTHGYPWPNCATPECDFKAQVPHDYCSICMNGFGCLQNDK